MANYIKVIEQEWVRPSYWKPIPNDDNLGNKIYFTFAVIEGIHNEFGFRTGTGSIIDWGDGTSGVVSGSSLGYIYKTYDYNTISGNTYQLDDGRNYKPVLVECEITTYQGANSYYFNVSNGENFVMGSTNVLEIVSYLGTGEDAPSTSTYLIQIFANSIKIPLVQRLHMKSPSIDTSYQSFSYMSNLKSISLPSNIISASQNNGGLFQHSNFNGYNFGDVNGGLTQYMFRYSGSFVIGNITGSLPIGTQLFGYCSNYRVGNVTILDCTSGNYMFGSTVSASIESIGLIDMPLLSDANYMFRNGQLPEIVFTDCSNITTAIDIFRNCLNLTKIILPGMRIGFDIKISNMTTQALDDMFNSLGIADGTQVIDVKNNPGSLTCDTTIATNKGFSVITS